MRVRGAFSSRDVPHGVRAGHAGGVGHRAWARSAPARPLAHPPTPFPGPAAGALPPAAEGTRLTEHLRGWLGHWPPRAPVEVVTAAARTRPGWDGRVSLFVAVQSPSGMVASVTPEALDRLGGPRAADSWDQLAADVATALDPAGGRFYRGVFRWAEEVVEMDPAGLWLPARAPGVPAWLHPFGGEVLVAFDERGAYAAGVGLKRHDPVGREIAVGTEDAHRGKGLARRLVSQAARRVLEEGRLPTYLHGLDNVASARVAEAVGFSDRGWRVMGFSRR